MPHLPLLLLFLLWTSAVAHAQEPLLLTFTQGAIDTDRTYSTDSATSTHKFSVVSGQQVILQNTSGQDYRIQNVPGSWSWVQVQQVAKNSTYIALAPHLQGEKVTVDVNYSFREGNNSTVYSSTVSGVVGEWILLLQPGGNLHTDDSKVYSSEPKSRRLSVRVDRQN